MSDKLRTAEEIREALHDGAKQALLDAPDRTALVTAMILNTGGDVIEAMIALHAQAGERARSTRAMTHTERQAIYQAHRDKDVACREANGEGVE